MWATFEGEKTKPIVTKLNRRGYATGKHTEKKSKKKEQPEAAATGARGRPSDAVRAKTPPTREPRAAEEPRRDCG